MCAASGNASSPANNLLLQASETVLEIADIAQINEKNKERKVFYTHLRFNCLRFRDHCKLADSNPSQHHGEQINAAVHHLGALVRKTDLPEVSQYAHSPEFRLKVLSLYWSMVPKQDDDAKLEFIGRWLVPVVSNEFRSELDQALEECADELDKQQPERSFVSPSEIPTSLDVAEPTHSIWKAGQSVFNALTNCGGCACTIQHTFKAKLELGTYRKPKEKADQKSAPKSIRSRIKYRDDNSTEADLHLDLLLSMDRKWNEVRVRAVKPKTVGFNIPGEGNLRRETPTPRGLTRVKKLCEPLSRAKNIEAGRLVLKLANGELFDMGFERSGFSINQAAGPVSLLTCFRKEPRFFTEKAKRILFLIISYAVLYLNSTSWLQPGWGSANVEFFRTTSSKTPFRPFIRTKLPDANPADATLPSRSAASGEESNGANNDALDDRDCGHRCLVLIDLAVVLIEVYFVSSFRVRAEAQGVQLNQDHRITLTDVDIVLYGDEEDDIDPWRSHMAEDAYHLLNAIDNCLNPELWEDGTGAALDSGTLTTKIYQHVVRPLELYLSYGFPGIPLDGVDEYARRLDLENWSQEIPRGSQDTPGSKPYTYTRSESSEALSQTQTQPPTFIMFPSAPVGVYPNSPQVWQHMPQYLQVQPPIAPPERSLASMSNLNAEHEASQFFDGLHDAERAEVDMYLLWRSEYERVYDKFINTAPPDSLPGAVKIAILDTGIDQDHCTFDARQENIKGRRNFYDESQQEIPDLNGHGTFAASLILDYARHVELYVIKIADRENARPHARIVANAIDHAINEWSVDIISMSFGWPSSRFDGKADLESAIDRASHKKVLMFAAASNSGAQRGRAYPASSSQVMCVHSTNTYGSASPFSPTPEPYSVNLATVGKSVESAGIFCVPGARPVEARSGTSYATPIMAGIAAFLLQYARLHLSGKEAQALKRRDRMEALLKRCAQTGPNYQPRDGYFYVQLSLNKHNLFGGDFEGVRREIQKTFDT